MHTERIMIMKRLFDAADRYIQTSDWKLIAVLKFCLLSLGVMAGMAVKKKHKKPVLLSALCVFIVTYIPLMARLFRIFFAEPEQEE